MHASQTLQKHWLYVAAVALTMATIIATLDRRGAIMVAGPAATIHTAQKAAVKSALRWLQL